MLNISEKKHRINKLETLYKQIRNNILKIINYSNNIYHYFNTYYYSDIRDKYGEMISRLDAFITLATWYLAWVDLLQNNKKLH